MNNPVRWFELYVSDMSRAKTFYEAVFKVKLTQIPFGEGEMWGFPSNPEKWGCSGTLVKMNGLNPCAGSTIIYFASENCAVEEEAIKKLGGSIHKSKMSIGPYGFITLAIDTEGNMIGIHSMN